MTQPVRYTKNRVKQLQALELLCEGKSLADIAAEVGYSGESAVSRAIKTVLERRETESVDAMRALENERLDRLQAANWKAAMAGDEKAAGILLRIADRRAKLNGLDAPTKTELSGTVTGEIAIREIVIERSLPREAP